jgi:DNA replication protein DnaC
MDIHEKLKAAGLGWMDLNVDAIIAESASRKASPAEVLARLLEGELEARRMRSVERRLRMARIPVTKSVADFNWAWPKNIDQDMVKDLLRLGFLKEKGNIVFMGGVGLGKTYLASAVAMEACDRNLPVLFTTAIEMVNNLQAATAVNGLQKAVRRYAAPALLVIDELGYLPIDRKGADLFFQVVSARHERASTVVTTNKAYRDWAATFAGDAALTSAILDRLTEKCSTVVIEGKSYRMRNKAKD